MKRLFIIGPVASMLSVLFLTVSPLPAAAIGDVWEQKAPKPTPTAGAVVGAIGGNIHAIGGNIPNQEGSHTHEVYDTATDTWSMRAPIPTPRSGATAGVINGRLYIVGGVNGPNSNTPALEIYDPNIDDWSSGAPLPGPLRNSMAAGVISGILYVAGGDSGGNPLNLVYAYDPVQNVWTQKASLLLARRTAGFAVLGNRLYVVGGLQVCCASKAEVQVYDPASDIWSFAAPLPSARNQIGVGVIDDKLYAVSGINAVGNDVAPDVWEYDPQADNWTVRASIPTPRAGLNIGTTTTGGKLYVIAGSTANGFSAATEVYVPITDTAPPDNQPPVADAGPDQTVECTAPGGTAVTLDGTGSEDPDGDPLTYLWTNSFGSASGATPTVLLPLGDHEVMLTVTDPSSASDADTLSVQVVDTAPPVISNAAASPSVLWPPNHRMVPVTVSVSASDLCDSSSHCKIISATSSEPDNGIGDGTTGPEIVITGDLTVQLRAERSGGSNGRVYTLEIQCTDESGNSSSQVVTVNVPHGRGN
ncbi:MAG: PKD domain-containing protein [Candidatus Methylomirabilis sp.]|nr:PKD domain-containing protein [Candidatus Methylomirabilis sp.]